MINAMLGGTDSVFNVQIYRYGEPGARAGLSIGVTRFLPRGVRREDYAALGYFDVWLPLLAPSRDLLAALQRQEITFSQFARRYRAEMRRTETSQTIRLIAATARKTTVYLGCFCADAARCHRTLLRDLIIAANAELPKPRNKTSGYFSPACSMPEIEDD